MSYMLVIQNDLMMPDCFCLARFKIYDGAVSFWIISSSGKVTAQEKGTIIRGRFHEE